MYTPIPICQCDSDSKNLEVKENAFKLYTSFLQDVDCVVVEPENVENLFWPGLWFKF